MLRLSLAALALTAALWAAAVGLTGGFAFSLAGTRITSSNAFRPLLLAAIAALVYVWYSGPSVVRADLRLVRTRLTPRVIAGLGAAAVAAIGVATNSWTAGGPDTFCYVTQADLALAGRLSVPVPLSGQAPWPDAIATFAPFGYAPTHDGTAVAPITGIGLPLLMAMLKAVGGHSAGFWVVPLGAALLIWTTFAIGRKLVSDTVGAGAAWIVATSPTVLAMIQTPMSDAPAAAFLALATLFVLRGSRAHDLIAGVLAGMAILIRPNLVPLAAVPGAWILVARSPGFLRDRVAGAAAFAAGAAPACLAIAAINNAVLGSPLASGYGRMSDLFSFAHVWPNTLRYGRWLLETQTPLALAGLVSLVLPWRRLWPDAAARRGAWLLAGMAIVVFAIYLVYLPFDAWWFLRFLLPAWPAMAIGTVALILRLKPEASLNHEGHEGREGHEASCASCSSWSSWFKFLFVFALGVYGLVITWRYNVFPGNEGERRYATVATLVEQATDPSAIVIAGMHAGPTRYYAGRLTMRFDALDGAWLDRAVEWLEARGRRTYILIEDWEMPAFRARFGSGNRLGRLDLAPALAYRAHLIPGTIYLFDPSKPEGPTYAPPPIRNPRPKCPLPNARWVAP